MMLLLLDSIGEHLSGALWQVAIFSALCGDPQLRAASPLINMTFFLFHLVYWTMEKQMAKERFMIHLMMAGHHELNTTAQNTLMVLESARETLDECFPEGGALSAERAWSKATKKVGASSP